MGAAADVMVARRVREATSADVLEDRSRLKPNTHRRRDETVELRRVGVGGVYMNSQLAHDDCRRIRRCERSRRP